MRRRMNKIMAAMLIGAMTASLALTGCGGKKSASKDGKKELKEALSAEEYEMVTAASEFKIKWFFFGNSDKNTEEEHTKESD